MLCSQDYIKSAHKQPSTISMGGRWESETCASGWISTSNDTDVAGCGLRNVIYVYTHTWFAASANSSGNNVLFALNAKEYLLSLLLRSRLNCPITRAINKIVKCGMGEGQWVIGVPLALILIYTTSLIQLIIRTIHWFILIFGYILFCCRSNRWILRWSFLTDGK